MEKTPLGAQWYHLVDPKTLRRWLEEFTALASLPTSLFVSNNPLHAEQVAWQSGLAEDFSSRAWDLSGWENHDCPQSSLTFWIVLEFAKENVVERCRKSCFTLVIDAFHVSVTSGFFPCFFPTTQGLPGNPGGVRLPVLRPVTLYITERYQPDRPEDVLVPEPREACVLYCILRAFTPATQWL